MSELSSKSDVSCAMSANRTISRGAGVKWLMLIYFASGACSLIDEVVWVRLLKLTLGNTVYAASVVVSIFMGGLALGALIMGRYADRVKMRLRLYALLETLVTISALALPLMLKLADSLYVWFYREYHPSQPMLLIVQVLISMAIILVPSMLMGSTFPLLGRFVTGLEKEAGHLVGKLYALNTLGAAAGCFLAGFIFIRAFGVMGTLYAAAALNIVVAFGGWYLSRFSTVKEEEVEQAEITAAEGATVKAPDGRFYVIMTAFFISGLISIGYELIWMRSIVHLLGGFTYVFSAVLTIYLLGNVIGAGIGSRLAKRLKNPAIGFSITLLLLGLCGIFYLQLMILWTSKILPYANNALKTLYSWSPACKYTVGPLLQSAFLFLVPTIIMGIGFPIALQAWANYVHKVGRSTGAAYGANTIGAVIGGIITGFVLIPVIGVQLSISVLGLMGVWIASVIFAVFSRRTVKRLIPIGAAIILTVFAARAPSNLFNIVVESSPDLPEGLLLLKVEEGVTTTVSVHKYLPEGSLELYASGQAIAGERASTRTDQKMLGHLAVLLNSETKEALTVGFGSGETTACLAQHKLERVDCAEIAPEVVKVSLEYFRHINLGDRLNDEINMIYMDAKNYIHMTGKTYDVIMNDSTHPRLFAENASLYTKEYFASIKKHLNKKGLLLCWVPIYDMPNSALRSIIGSMMEVFPHVTLWYPNHYHVNYFWLVASEEEQYFSLKHIENELRKEDLGKSLSEIDINNSIDVMAYYICDENDLKRHFTDYPVNSDYHPFVEFTTDRSAPPNELLKQYITEVRSNSIHKHIDWRGLSDEEKEKWLALYEQVYRASTYLFMAYTANDSLSQLMYVMDGLAILPEHPGLLDAKSEAEKRLFSDSVRIIMSGNTDKALELADLMLKIYPQSATAWMIRSGAMQGAGNLEEALVAAQRAVEFAPGNADAHYNLGFILYRLGQLDKAIAEYREVLRLKPEQFAVLQMLAQALIQDKNGEFYNPSEAVRCAERVCELTGYRNVQFLDTLATAYAAAGRITEAISTLETAMKVTLSAGQEQTAESIRNRIILYKAMDAARR